MKNMNMLRPIVESYFYEKYPSTFNLSQSKLFKLLRKWNDGYDIIEELNSSYDHLKVLTNYPFYWYNIGCSIKDSEKYATEKGWLVCPWCGSVYHISTKYKSCCSEECYVHNINRRNQRLSISRKKYNPRDPIQYADRHSIELEKATTIIRDISKKGSRFCVEYWIERGYSLEEAIGKVSGIQRKNSPRCIEYWVERGFSQEDALIAISEIQSENGKRNKQKHVCVRKFSIMCVEFWMDRGYTEFEAIEHISNIQRNRSVKRFEKYTNEELRVRNHLCIEYWQYRYPENYIQMYEDHRNSILTSNAFRSDIADEFFNTMNEKFSWLDSNRYFGDNEFGLYDEEVGYLKYDYVDTKLKICIEFNGDYWHANPSKYKPDDVLQFPNNKKLMAQDIWKKDILKTTIIENRGYRVYVVWEDEYKTYSGTLIDRLYEEILNEIN